MSSSVRAALRTTARCGALLSVLLAGAASVLPAQQTSPASGVVAGTVVDSRSLLPLDNVQVGVQGSSLGAVTDAAGRFRVQNVPGTQVTLQLRRLGYRPLNETVRVGQTDLRLVLVNAPAVLNEVVVTGTAEPVEKRALGNSVTKINAAVVQQVAPAPNVSSLINGRAPGVVVIAGSGAVGSGPRIRIRGAASLSLSDQPLIYVDGIRIANDISTGPTSQFFGSSVISRLNDINPDDIESIEIVKGPAAATLYGTEANNGVIQIITKRGKVGRPVFTATVREGTNWFMNAQERIGYNYNKNPLTGQIQRWNPVEEEHSIGRELFKNGLTQSYDIGLNGGSEAVRYNFTTGYDNDKGIEPTNSLWRYTGNANLSIVPRSNLSIDASLGINRQQINVPLEAGGGMWFSAYFGQAPRTKADSLRRGFVTAPPEAYWAAFRQWQRVSRTTGALTVTHHLGEWFTQRLTVGNDLTGEDNVNYTQRMDAFLRQFFTNPVDQNGSKQNRRRELNVTSVDYAGTLKAQLPRGITANTSGGAQFFRRDTYAMFARGEGFPAAGLSQVDAAATFFAGEATVTNTTVGFYGQEQFGVGDRFFVTAAVRVDDNSAFGSNFKWTTYPKVAASWVINEEPWWGRLGALGAINALKLRAAYGETGQQPVTFSALRTFAPVTGGDGTSAVTPNTLGNPDLKPERAKEIELGFDGAAFQNRLTAEFNWYRRDTHDAILAQSVAPSSGFPGTKFTNVALIRSQGVELQTRAGLVTGDRFNLDLGVNVAHNTNTVLDVGLGALPLDQQFIGSGNIRHQVGYPVGSFWDRRIVSAEFTASGTTTNAMCDDGKGGVTPCFDASGGIVAPRVYMGRGDSPNEGSVNATATLFKRVRLYALVDWKQGNVQFDNDSRVRCQVFRLCLANLNPTEYPATLIAQYNSPNTLRQVFYSNASYAKLREVSASLSLPSRLVQRVNASAATLTLSGRNLHTWTKWSSVDPETFFTVEPFARTAQAQVPPLAQFLASLTFTF